ncbi:MAG: hypothetical protein QE274_16495 [Verrucomicrobiaceae bacterium]|nr:hypothetical protein [Verrucomicrobiaceae bacterium]
MKFATTRSSESKKSAARVELALQAQDLAVAAREEGEAAAAALQAD